MLKSYCFLRFWLAFALLLFGLLVLVRAKVVWLFQLQLGATEYGHWFAVGALLLAVAGPWRSWGAVVAVVAVGFLMSSAVRAAWFSRNLQERFASGSASGPFSWTRLWMGEHSGPTEKKTMVYAEHDGAALQMDFYPGLKGKPCPCVIVLHLGGWDAGTREEFPTCCRDLQNEGYAVASIDYRLAPKNPWPAQRQDVVDAVHFLQEGAETYGIRKDKFVLLGRSAGGQIASAVALEGIEPAICGCVSLYGPADLNYAWQYCGPDDILNSEKLLRQYLGGTPKEKKAEYDSASALLHVCPQSVPVLLIHGTLDEMVWCTQSERLAAKLKENGVRHHFLELPWATHVFDYNSDGPGGQIAEWAIIQFLGEVSR